MGVKKTAKRFTVKKKPEALKKVPRKKVQPAKQKVIAVPAASEEQTNIVAPQLETAPEVATPVETGKPAAPVNTPSPEVSVTVPAEPVLPPQSESEEETAPAFGQTEDQQSESSDNTSMKPLDGSEQNENIQISLPIKKSHWFFLVIPLIIIFFAVCGFFILQKVKGTGDKAKAPSVTVASKPSVSATPAHIVSLTKYTIQILNGSGIAGAAGKAKETLTADGFKVGTVGNASGSNYKETIIAAKKTVDTVYLKKLQDALKKSYTLGSSETLSEKDAPDVDVSITIGSQPAQ